MKRLKINDSETTIYRKAVPEKSNRFSSSSDEFINTSDEIEGERINDFITDCREEFESRRERNDYQPIPTFHGPEHERRLPPPKHTLEEGRANQMVCEAEHSRARIFDVAGNEPNYQLDLDNKFYHSSMVDETYLSVASHVEETIVKRII